MTYLVRVYHREHTPSDELYFGPFFSQHERDRIIDKIEAAIEENGDDDFQVEWNFLNHARSLESELDDMGLTL